MADKRKRYDHDHWIRSEDPAAALEAYLEQQSKVYSIVKNHFVSELLGDLKGRSVLDYGCGAGYFVVHSARMGARSALGIDAEEGPLAAARLFAQREGVERVCQFMRSSAFPRFEPNTRFDLVILKDIIEHVIDDEGLLEDVSAVLNPDGAVVISTQNSMSLNFLLEGGYKRYIQGRKLWLGWDDTHVRFYTPVSLTRKLTSAGLKTDLWRSVYIVPHKIPTMSGEKKDFFRVNALAWADKRLGAIFPFNYLGWNIIVRAKSSPMVKEMRPIVPPGPKVVAPGPAI